MSTLRARSGRGCAAAAVLFVVAGDRSGRPLFTPCDVVTAPNGDIFVSEGHTGHPDAPPETVARIVKFDKDGNFIDKDDMLYGLEAGHPDRQRPQRGGHVLHPGFQFGSAERHERGGGCGG